MQSTRCVWLAAILFVISDVFAQPCRAQALTAARSSVVTVVVAENVYADIVAQLGGADVAVTSIINQPNQDPHLFEASPATARRIAGAQLVVYNGAGYDLWISKLLAASKSAQRKQIIVASLVGKKAGDNPHLWYLPETMPALARAVHAFLVRIDCAHQRDYDTRLLALLTALSPIDAKIATLRANYRGVPITATEPVLDYLAQAVGLKMRNARFQRALMNGTAPSAADIAAFENDLRNRRVKALIYNMQTSSAITQRMLKLARIFNVPVVQISEMPPANVSYQQWMLSQLSTLEQALAGASK